MVKIEDENVKSKNKQLIQGQSVQDGVLVSPIDLALGATRPLQLEPLRWVHFDVPPFRMKLTNSGDTLVVSAKWAKERPYLSGGPLDGTYVFSQIHFHWG
ncbi:carbonic anhydrase family protein, partial [Pseudophaeobacter profundi]|uniref:carbonic anhydrase family protein n=1 Tax=Pseudophaeobacter profundi TaxID=3034152 RepID=UPI00242B5831